MANWLELNEMKPLDPKTPAEYLEALRRLINIFIEDWDLFPDGDGINGTLPDDANQTKTDMFLILISCAQYALDNIRDFHKMVDNVSQEG